MKIKLPDIFKYLACCSCFLSLFPFIAVFNGALADKYSIQGCLLQLVWVVLWGFAGYLFSFMFQNKRRKFPVRTNLIFVLSCILPMAISLVLLHNNVLIFRILMAVLTLTSYCIGRNIFYLGYGQMMSRKMFIVVIVLNMLSIAFLHYMEYPYSMGLFICIFICVASMYGIVQNQANIDFLMERRQHKMENLPKKIRLYNMKLMAIVFGVMLVCFLMKDWIAAFITWLLHALREVVRFIIYGIERIFELINVDTSTEEMQSTNELQKLPKSEDNSTSYNWLIVVLAAVVVVWIIHNRKKILRFFISALQKLVGIIKRFLHKSHILNKPNSDSEYYYDNEEFIKPEDFQNVKSPKENIRQWMKSCKSFYKMVDTAEKFRFGYNLVIDGLKFSGLTIIQSDTTLEILDKSSNLMKSQSYSLVTEEYNLIRYGNNFEPARFENLYEALQTASNLIGTKPKARLKN